MTQKFVKIKYNKVKKNRTIHQKFHRYIIVQHVQHPYIWLYCGYNNDTTMTRTTSATTSLWLMTNVRIFAWTGYMNVLVDSTFDNVSMASSNLWIVPVGDLTFQIVVIVDRLIGGCVAKDTVWGSNCYFRRLRTLPL